MAVYESIVDFNKVFNSLHKPPIIINDIVNASEEEKEVLKQTIFSYYKEDIMSTIPTCECGELVGEYNLGDVCTNCNTVCENAVEDELESTVWMRSPHGVKKLIHPIVFYMLNQHFKYSGVEIIRYIADPTYKPLTDKVPKELKNYLSLGFVNRGYNYFVQNFDLILGTLFKITANKKSETMDPMEIFIAQNRDKLFSNYLPLPNKALLIVIDIPAGKFVDPLVVGAIDAIQTIASIDANDNTSATMESFHREAQTSGQRTIDELSQKSKENRTIKCIAKLAEFYPSYFGDSLSGKPGLIRRQIAGARAHFSFRTVISSITKPHDHNEVSIPWSVALGALKLHVLNKLSKLNFTVKDSLTRINRATRNFDPLINNIFIELINESYVKIGKKKIKGIPITLGRNPSLKRASIQHLAITSVKTDLSDPTTGLSILDVVGLSADNDGLKA